MSLFLSILSVKAPTGRLNKIYGTYVETVSIAEASADPVREYDQRTSANGVKEDPSFDKL